MVGISPERSGLLSDLSRFSFGATSAVTSSIALLVGLDQLEVSKMGIIGALLVIGFADNIADSLGIHIYSESKSKGHPRLNTIANYLTRALITCIPIFFVFVLPLQSAILASVVLGLIVIAAISYMIALSHGVDPWRGVAEHLAVTVVVLVSSRLIGSTIRGLLGA